MVVDPQKDRAAALAQVQAALRPEGGRERAPVATSTG
jgi:hypothetical protein